MGSSLALPVLEGEEREGRWSVIGSFGGVFLVEWGGVGGSWRRRTKVWCGASVVTVTVCRGRGYGGGQWWAVWGRQDGEF